MGKRRLSKFFFLFVIGFWIVQFLRSPKDEILFAFSDLGLRESSLKDFEEKDYMEDEEEEVEDYGDVVGFGDGVRSRDRFYGQTYREIKLDYNKTSRRLWEDDTDQVCSKMEVRFASGMNGSILHSFPRSGNTWVRYLVEAASGIFTSSVYTDRTLIAAGYLGERHHLRYKTTIATKSHFIKHLQKYSYVPTVTIIRNPARVFISLWSYVNLKDRRSKHVKSVPESTMHTQEFHEFVEAKLKKWLNTTLFALTKCTDVLPVSYELVRENPTKEVRRILEYLRVKPDEERLSCLARHVAGNVRGAQKTLDPYTEAEKGAFRRAVERVNEALSNRGFPPLPDYSKYEN